MIQSGDGVELNAVQELVLRKENRWFQLYQFCTPLNYVTW